jgi:quercetin dioxygenase-like cupin family protein
MRKPLVRTIEECKPNDRSMIFLEEECETISVNVVVVKKGERILPSSHPDEEEVYIITKGKGIVKLDDVEHTVSVGTAIYIPRNTVHEVIGLPGQDFEYVCVANWPDKIPDN